MSDTTTAVFDEVQNEATDATDTVAEDVLVEEVSIDGMCGVY